VHVRERKTTRGIVMPFLTETFAVLGCGPQAASLMLRECLRFKTRCGSLIVQDATGRGAMLLTDSTKMGLERRRVVWVDLADRRHPVCLFQIHRSQHSRNIWIRVLRSLRDIAKFSIADEALNWAAEAAYSLSSDGSVGLGTLLRCLSSTESRRWFLDTKNEPSDLGKILDLLSWTLSFPAVHALSEGENRGQIIDAVIKPSVLWLESSIEHFEPKEHLVLQVLIDGALEDALRTMAAEQEKFRDTLKGLTLLHFYPVTSVSVPLQEWIDAHQGMIRHVGVHHLEASRPLSSQTLPWVQQAECIWTMGTGAIDAGCHASWLTPAEACRISELNRGELWIKSNRSGKAIVTRVHDIEADHGLVGRFRAIALRRRKTASIDQVAAAVRSLSNPPGAHRDLYSALCDIEALRASWFRVQESKARAAGVDGVSPPGFGDDAENHLRVLSAELRSGRYRARPLRRVQIPKPDGGVRDLGIACVRDRVVQVAALALLEPIFEPAFSRFSYAFRPRRSAHQAVAVARAMIASGRPWALIADIRKCFDTIDHDVLLGLLAKKIADEEFLSLVRNWLTVDVLEFRDLIPTEAGVPQGESISPLLANVYLDPLDRHLEKLGIAFVRYADDFVIFTESEQRAKETYRCLADFLRDVLHLELKPAKSSYVPVAEGFDFLGFRITDSSLAIAPDRSNALLQYLSGHIGELAEASGAFDKIAQCLNHFNSTIRGWRNYFLLPNEPVLAAQLQELDNRVDEIAAIKMPDTLRENPAWLCRERLAMIVPSDDRTNSHNLIQKPPQPDSDYPRPCSPEAPSMWMARPDNRPSLHIESTGQSTTFQTNALASGKNGVSPSLFSTTMEDGDRLYVLTHGTYLTVDDDDLILRRRREEIYRQPIERISLIYLQGRAISISVDAHLRLAEHDVPVVLALPLGNPVAVVNPIETNRSSIRRLQAVCRDDREVLRVGIGMIAAKISNQAAVLKYFAKYRKRTNPEVFASMGESAEKIRSLSQSVLALDPGEANVRGVVMGFEGHAASIYWAQLARLIPGDLGFGGRITLSAHDPVNQCLNYVYGILYGEVWRAVVKAGLDPYFGLIHGSLRDQGSLIFDLIEEFRAPFADRIVIGMLGRGFHPEVGRKGLLRSRVKQQLVHSFTKRWSASINYRSRDLSPAKLLAMQANCLVNVFRRKGTYHPYRMRW
jgi:RNA-directed DNA polymerase